MKDFGKKLRELRALHRISLDKLSKDLGMSKVTLCRYETSETEPKLSYIKDIADYFDTSVDYFLEDKEKYKFNMFVKKLAFKLEDIGFDFDKMSTQEKEAIADLLVLSVKQALEAKETIIELPRPQGYEDSFNVV